MQNKKKMKGTNNPVAELGVQYVNGLYSLGYTRKEVINHLILNGWRTREIRFAMGY